ncbi:mechanosensitive ion channel family protein, partial [Cyclobacteriaceae bacterium]|nr:mechanosensitive ion channel family protein [Cyclobacteriaceae bacterium]
YGDSLTKGGITNRYIISEKLPELYLIKIDTAWLLSSSSVKSIEPLYRKTHVLGTEKLQEFTHLFQSKYAEKLPFEIHPDSWRYLGISIFILAIILCSFIFYYLLKVIGFGIFIKKPDLRQRYYRLIIPFSIWVIGFAANKVLPSLGIHSNLLITLIHIGNIVRVIFFITFAFRLIDFVVSLGKETYLNKSTYKKGFVPFIGMFLKVALLITGILIILDNFGINLKDSLTGLSVLGLALALAAQDTVKNFFGSIMIFLDRPFQVGDWVKTNNIDGDIESIGLRTTKIRTYDNSLISIPNSTLTDSTLNNMGMRNYRRFKTYLTVKYDIPIENIEAFLTELRYYVQEHEYTYNNIIRIHLNDYSEYGYRILFDVFFDVESYNEELRQRGLMVANTAKLAQKHGVTFAVRFDTHLHMGTQGNAE